MAEDLFAELGELVAGFRATLEALGRFGVDVVPAGEGAATLPAAAHGAPPPPPHASPSPAKTAPDLAAIAADLGDCHRCRLAETRKNIVFGVGACPAPLMFVGEAPGADEDRRGEPFVGRAGQLLDRMIAAMGWTRDAVYIANVLKCRPPGNRDPRPDEVAECEPFLRRQIAAVAPRVIVALGRPAAHLLLSTTAPISALRGRFFDAHGTRVMPTFHPAYLLRSPERKRDAWSDLQQVMGELSRLGIAAPASQNGDNTNQNRS